MSLGPPRLGEGAAGQEARRVNDLKLVLGGDPVLTPLPPCREPVPVPFHMPVQVPSVRIERELGRRVRDGDRNGTADLLSGWVDKCTREPAWTPARGRWALTSARVNCSPTL
ncbi:hypothetical protein ACIBO5_56050 [Nonomuraea angiospora]|uniref:hypothetical protein n=1 Tax=Nonomuraea angiospora TaxID=46172 RepID=UPI0029B11C55|nr:hypothetical protein [Nonomuraea angiospora]MDX3104507.1 hypothetical protein [Nonomuraea angiospora]